MTGAGQQPTGDHQAAPDPGDLAVDGMVAHLSGDITFLLDVTPVNAEEARAEYLSGDGRAEPRFEYRDLSVDPAVMAASLDAIPLGDVTDPELGTLLRSKVREMGLQMEMLAARNTEEFLPLSMQLYGSVLPSLAQRAADLLDRLPPTPPRPPGGAAEEGGRLDAPAFLELARAELDYYRSVDPEVTMHAEIRADVTGILVSGDTLLISDDAGVDRGRANALLQHEVGTHLLTQVNGSAQPVRSLGVGLAGYDETQEGLAVLAEIACGGLTVNRLRQLAARVVTIHHMTTGATFHDSHQALVDAGFSPAAAFTVTMRAYRSGGLTKDAIYLRGLLDLLAHVAGGGVLDLLWLGKFALTDLPLVEDLAGRGVLVPPRIVPRYLSDPLSMRRIAEAATTDDLVDLTQGTQGAA